MKNVFRNKKVNCSVCDTPTDGRYKRGAEYYCASHYQSESIQEKLANKFQDRRKEKYDKIHGST